MVPNMATQLTIIIRLSPCSDDVVIVAFVSGASCLDILAATDDRVF